MGLNLVTYALAKKYTDDSMAGGGISAGKNCVVDSITDITGGHRVTFKWTLDNGTVKTGTMDVMDGAKGDKGDSGDAGLGIKSVAVNAEDHLIITYDDDTTQDAGQIQITADVDSVNGKTGEVVLDASDVGALPDDTIIPSKTSDLDNDSNFAVDANYVHTDNNYDTTAKGIVDGVTAALADKVDKVQGKGLSTNDYTDADKAEVAKVADKADADDVIDGASYDSTNHLILFKNGTTTLFSLDAAAFVKDGMVDTVEITGGNLVITFNTDAGKQAISIPLTDIFDPANYYNKTATDNLLADKADKSTVIQFKTTTETDANNLWEENGYYIVNTSDMTNLPTTDVSMGYCLEVIRYGSFSNALVVQIAYRGNPTTESPMYMRRRFNDVWTDWIAIAKKSDVTGKADKVSGATNDNFAGLDANGNLTDSGKKASDFGTADEIADIVNVYGSKNLNRYPYCQTTKTQNGITFTDNGDGTITVNGTATANADFLCHFRTNADSNDLVIPNGTYILTGCPSGGATSSYDLGANRTHNGSAETLGRDIGNGIQIVLNGDDYSADEVNLGIFIEVKSGTTVSNLTFRPMLRLASIEDDTYVPYVPTNAKLDEEKVSWKANGILGAKNLNSYPYVDTTKTSNGVTFTDNGDGTITASGTATADAVLNCHTRTIGTAIPLFIPNGRYIISGCPSGGSLGTYLIRVAITKNASVYELGDDYGDGREFIINGDDTYTDKVQLQIQIIVKNGTTVNNLVFKPMLRLASDPDNTYQPYAMTNRELTEKKISIADLKSVTAASSDFADFQTRIAAL